MTQVTLLYDRDCGFCRWCLGKLLAWDRPGSLRPVALQSEEAERLLTGMPEEERLASWHLVDDDGTVRSAGAAFPGLFRRYLPMDTVDALRGSAGRLAIAAFERGAAADIQRPQPDWYEDPR